MAPVRIAWLALLVGVITFAGMFWSEHRAEQIASAEREQAVMEPAPLDGAVIGHEALMSDFAAASSPMICGTESGGFSWKTVSPGSCPIRTMIFAFWQALASHTLGSMGEF